MNDLLHKKELLEGYFERFRLVPSEENKAALEAAMTRYAQEWAKYVSRDQKPTPCWVCGSRG